MLFRSGTARDARDIRGLKRPWDEGADAQSPLHRVRESIAGSPDGILLFTLMHEECIVSGHWTMTCRDTVAVGVHGEEKDHEA